jgi:hypothetical protein
VEYQENLPLSQEYVCPVGSFIFCPTVKIEIQSLPLLSVFDYGTRVTHPASICFLDYKEILSKFTFAICSIPKLFF